MNRSKDARLASTSEDGSRLGKRAARVVEVIPISRGMTKPALSYFTTRVLSVGDFIKVPVRHSSLPAVVIRVHNASSAKGDLKQSSFSLKKISEQNNANAQVSLPETLMEAAKRTADFYASTTGSVLGTLIPKVFFDNPGLVWGRKKSSKTKSTGPKPKYEPLVIQLETRERMAQYRSITRECLAKKKSVMVVAPTDEEASRLYATLSKGIEEYAYLFSLSKPPKEQKKIISSVKETSHSILLVTTPAGIALDRYDLDTVILERESSRAYRAIVRPQLHWRVFLEIYANLSKKRLILGDSVLSVESLWKERSGEYKEHFPISWRLETECETTLVDMKKPVSSATKPEFRIISPELEELITNAVRERSQILLFGARKGLAPTTVCEDCGSVLSCRNCGAPVVLYMAKDKSQNFYLCHACGARRSAETTCDSCGGWRLSPLGIGIDRIKEEISSLFPKTRILLLDKNHAPTAVQARKIAREFKQYGGILIGTELALLFVEETVYSGLVSTDALFSIPDFGIHEKVFHLTSRLREITRKETIIQTRNIGKQVLAWAAKGNILDFYRSEIAEREELLYPPFSIFIKIAGEGAPEVSERFEKWGPDVLKNSVIIRLPRDKWPDPELTSKLALLGPEFLIKVDPESIL